MASTVAKPITESRDLSPLSSGSSRSSVSIFMLALVAVWVALSGCERIKDRFTKKHIAVASLEDLGYPSCEGKVLGRVHTVAEELIRSGPTHSDHTIVERYGIYDNACQVIFGSRQEWPMGTTDFEVVYDKDLLPLRIWKRDTVPLLPNAGEKADIRSIELRSQPIGIKRSAAGSLSYEQLKGVRPQAVIGPGRGSISIWIRRAKLKPGQKVREPIIDVRALEKIEPVTLMREPDMVHPELGPVRVYTYYGRETVFVDQNDMVVGDLAGMRADKLLSTPRPPAIPTFGVVDPVHTP
ncbi:MAG: hypothetical protein JWN48_2114 [Myxococcaceae bacterium]|nr:hypothetical protein [Myxococcaceae bacterium]